MKPAIEKFNTDGSEEGAKGSQVEDKAGLLVKPRSITIFHFALDKTFWFAVLGAGRYRAGFV